MVLSSKPLFMQREVSIYEWLQNQAGNLASVYRRSLPSLITYAGLHYVSDQLCNLSLASN